MYTRATLMGNGGRHPNMSCPMFGADSKQNKYIVALGHTRGLLRSYPTVFLFLLFLYVDVVGVELIV